VVFRRLNLSITRNASLHTDRLQHHNLLRKSLLGKERSSQQVDHFKSCKGVNPYHGSFCLHVFGSIWCACGSRKATADFCFFIQSCTLPLALLDVPK